MKFVSIGIGLLCVLASTITVGQVIYNNASTAGEGYARGVSGIIRSQGQAQS